MKRNESIRLVSVLFLLLSSLSGWTQYKQDFRGTVVDQMLQTPLAGATVIIQPGNLHTLTDHTGAFHFKDLALGSYQVRVSYGGYKEYLSDKIELNSGKEVVLTVSMETLVHTEEAVLLKAESRKNKPLNEMSAVSARAFSVEETQRYAAAVNDPLRMATSFPGVVAVNDGNNSIIIRGNSSAGLLWRMEGMDIPNPNHFSIMGGTGGGISILSAQLLANSDFVTAAFAAEYGNALSGVFDLKLRKGNNEKREYTVQAGLLGLNAAAEGPFSRNYKGSYLINYRYSTLALLSKAGVLDAGAANFQDLSYNIYLPGKAGTFTVFGFTGRSDDRLKPDLDSAKWEDHDDRRPYQFVANTSMNGVTHSIALGSRATLRSGVGYSSTRNEYDEDYIRNDYSLSKEYTDRYQTKKTMLNSSLNYRFSNQLYLRAGFSLDFQRFDYYQLASEHEGGPLEEVVNVRGSSSLQQLYGQVSYKLSSRVVFNGGIHYLRLSLRNRSALEPRLSLRWNLRPRSSLSFGYGLHSQQQPMAIYFAKQQNPDGSWNLINKNLSFTRAHHYVLSFSQQLAAALRLKAEVYYQHLFNVPVSLKEGSTFSTVNINDEYFPEPLSNTGKARNYGMEISLERYLQDDFYLTWSSSFYQSKYTAADGRERNTRFNGNYTLTLISGKDFINERRTKTFGLNFKAIYAGGLRTTPIDLALSRQEGYAVYMEDLAFSLQNPAYFRTDLRVSIKWNRKRVTSTLSLDIQNLTNRLNVYNQRFDNDKNNIVTDYQTGLIPVLNYKVEF